MIGKLPRSLEVNGKFYRIGRDFEGVYICLFILYEDFNAIPKDDYEAAFKAALAFIDHNDKPEDTGGKPPPRVMDWEQDENIMFPAVNKVAGFEVRSAQYVHWWTFMGKKLEKWEREYWNSNRAICALRTKLSEEEQAEKNRIDALLS